MQAHGADRVRRGSGDQWILLSPRDKGWLARTPPDLIRRERPGSAVCWDGVMYEVISSSPSGSGTRYVLAPWREEHVYRTVERYDREGEAQREAEYRAAVARQRYRRVANLSGVLTGHLPAPVQERLGSELGILPTRLTALSLLLPALGVGMVMWLWADRKLAGGAPPGLPLMLLAGYLTAESALRLTVVWSQQRAIGSTIGVLFYTLVYALAPDRRELPPPLVLSERRAAVAAHPETALRDALLLREPLLTLLTPGEQVLAAARVGYDYRRIASRVAGVILLFAVLGVVTLLPALERGAGVSRRLSLFCAAVLALEQLGRLIVLRRRPAGSLLRFLVRPLVKQMVIGEAGLEQASHGKEKRG